jgi:hypothetical protein
MITNGDSEPVGELWYAIRHKFNAQFAYVYSVDVWPEHQRQGHASRAFLALEPVLKSHARQYVCGDARLTQRV